MLMREGLNDEWGILKLQNSILMIMSDIHKCCVDNDIQYTIAGGTLLGAVRHGGFIPWDDDIDIYMTKDNYEKFKEVFFSMMNEKYYLQEAKVNTHILGAKVRANNTTYIEPLYRKRKDMHQGIFVDIFIVRNISNHKIIQYIQYLAGKYITICRLIDRGYTGNLKKKLFLGLVKVTPRNLLKPLAYDILTFKDEKGQKYIANFLDRLLFKHCVYPADLLLNLTLIDFESIKLYAPIEAKKILEIEFGDYMTPPPINEIKRMQHAELWDTENDYSKYVG